MDGSMKKTIIILCMAAGLLSCAKESIITHEKEAGTPVSFEISMPETKAAKTAWASGDIVYIFFKGLAAKYLQMTYNGSSWDTACPAGTINDSDLSVLAEAKITAIHFPVAVNVAYADSKFSFTNGGKPVFRFWLSQENRGYTLSGTTVTASISLNKPSSFAQFHIPGIQSQVNDYTFACSLIRPGTCSSVDITNGSCTLEYRQYGSRMEGVADEDGVVFSGYIENTSSAKDYVFVLSSTTNIYTLTRASKTLSSWKKYNFPALSETGGANWSVQAVSALYEDLGLSVKWAKCNLGSTEATDYGSNSSYYSWGETRTKSNYGSSYYVWKPYDSPTKYNVSDALTTLLPEDDAAYAALGGNWRIPTSAEWTELNNTSNCTWTWYSNYNSSGIAGYLVTSKISGHEGNSIFLPAAGQNIATSATSTGTDGIYWSADLQNTGSASGYTNTFYNKGHTLGIAYRYYGLKIRPVCD